MTGKRGLSLREVCEATGLSRGQLEHIARSKVHQPSEHASRGTGDHRSWSKADCVVLAALSDVHRAYGVPFSFMRGIAFDIACSVELRLRSVEWLGVDGTKMVIPLDYSVGGVR